MGVVLAVDPGREKCGFALGSAAASKSFHVLVKGIVRVEEIPQLWQDFASQHPELVVVLGSGTGSTRVREILEARGAKCALVDEQFSTRRARDRYFQEHRPRGWRRLIPQSLLSPPRPVDDFAALVLAEDWLKLQALLDPASPIQPPKT